jgi:hypothetical protein
MEFRRIAAAAKNLRDRHRLAGSQPRRPVTEIVHLFVLTSFACAQPVYDRVGENPAFLFDMGVRPTGIFLLAAAFSFVLPSILAAFIWGVGKLWPRARDSVHSIVVFLLLTVAVAPLVNRVEYLPGWLLIGLTVATGASATWSYFTFRRVRSVVTVAAPVILAFPAFFLLTSPVARHFFFPQMRIQAARRNPVPVVVVVLDELCGMTLMNERHEIDADRFPHFAELGRGSTWFRNATTVFPDTWQAVPAILSGRYPTTTWTPLTADRPQNLFSVLDATGAYELAIFEPVSRLARQPKGGTLGPDAGALSQFCSMMPALGSVLLFQATPHDLQFCLPEVPPLWFGFHELANVDRQQRHGVFRYAKADDRLAQFDHFLDCLDDSRQPQLDFFHVLLPHIPWCYLPSGRKCIADSERWELLDDALVADDLFAEQCQQRHLLQLEFVDSQIGRLLGRLRDTGLYDKCLLVVMADHGVSFKAGEPRRFITDGNLPDIMSIPLFIKAPGQQSGAINDRNVESVDILPTIAKFLGIELYLPVDGVSVFDTALPERKEKTLCKQETLGRAPVQVSASILEHSTVPQEIRRRFGAANDPEALFRIGPHPELIGRRVADLPTSAESPTELSLSRSGSEYTHDHSELVPCYIEGRVAAPPVSTTPVVLAVAVNGFIRATTRTYRFDKYRAHFTAMVPESAFHEGRNDVAYYTITGSPHELHLTPCIVKDAASK